MSIGSEHVEPGVKETSSLKTHINPNKKIFSYVTQQ